MGGSGRPPDVAGRTPLQSHLLPLDCDSHVASRNSQIARGCVVRVCSEGNGIKCGGENVGDGMENGMGERMEWGRRMKKEGEEEWEKEKWNGINTR